MYLAVITQYGGAPNELEYFDTLEEAQAYTKGLVARIYKEVTNE